MRVSFCSKIPTSFYVGFLKDFKVKMNEKTNIEMLA
jgi:hypothetical protein